MERTERLDEDDEREASGRGRPSSPHERERFQRAHALLAAIGDRPRIPRYGSQTKLQPHLLTLCVVAQTVSVWSSLWRVEREKGASERMQSSSFKFQPVFLKGARRSQVRLYNLQMLEQAPDLRETGSRFGFGIGMASEARSNFGHSSI